MPLVVDRCVVYCQQVHLEHVQQKQKEKVGDSGDVDTRSTGAVRPRHPMSLDEPPSIQGPPESMMPELLISRPSPEPLQVLQVCDNAANAALDSIATTAAETSATPETKQASTLQNSGLADDVDGFGPMCASLTDHSRNSVTEHIEQTLRMRLGINGKLISGRELHDAAVSLGLTRYTESDVNTIVNKLASFVHLRFEQTDKKSTRLQHSGTFSRFLGVHRRDAPIEMTIDERSRAIWEWPHDGASSMTDFLRGNVSEAANTQQHNLVPFQALVMAFSMDGDGRKIFGTSAELFRAIKELFLAGDTNRLVAELTFVRINDLAAPTQPTDPVLYIEPFVALLIVANAALLGLQTDVAWEEWAGWQWVEVAFTLVFAGEILVRIRLVGLRYYLSGPESTWNYFDMFLVMAGLIDILLTSLVAESEAAATQLLRSFRLVRLTRTFRVFRLKFLKDCADLSLT